MLKEGLLIVISGPSGAGKGAVCSALLKDNKDLLLSVSCTTRKPRPDEKDGVEYFFKSQKEFYGMIEDGKLLEYARVFDSLYGTPLGYVEEMLKEGRDVLLEIDVQGAMKVKDKYPEAVFIFILPPSIKELERRIRKRKTENEEQIQSRLKKANSEIKRYGDYDYVIVNDVVPAAADKIKCILCAEKQKTCRNVNLDKKLKTGEVII